MTRTIFLCTLILASGMAMAIEKPKYRVIEKVGDIEVRQYEPMIVARTRVTGSFEDAGNAAFRRLANYIFGGNQREQKISMTAPVSQTPDTVDGYWVTFMMPARYRLEDLPRPKDASIELVKLPPRTMAAIRYRGGWSENLYKNNEAKLKQAMRASASWKITGEPVWARYNSPMMPSLFRTNEILVPVKANSQEAD